MNEDSQQFGGLVQHSFEKQVEKLLEQSQKSMALLDEEAMIYQVDQTFYAEQIQSLEEQLKGLHEEKKQSAERLQKVQERQEMVESRMRMCRDLQGLLKGTRFVAGGPVPEFFTVSQSDFASAQGLGEMSLEAEMQRSEDGFRLEIGGKKYCFVRSREGKGFFHETSLSTEMMEALFGEMNIDDSEV